jgi:hypothetical protein
MSATRLSYTDVLTDEFEYFFGSPDVREWTIRRKAIRELPSLGARIKAIRATEFAQGVVPRRFFVLHQYALSAELEAGRELSGEEAVLAGFTSMVKDPMLFERLLNDEKVKESLRDPDSLLLRKLVSVPYARRLLLENKGLRSRIANDETLVGVFTSRSAALRLSISGLSRTYLTLYPLLSTIADSKELSDYLIAQDIEDLEDKKAEGRRRRKLLVELLEHDLSKALTTGLMQRATSLFRPRPRDSYLSFADRAAVAARADKLLELLKSPPVAQAQPAGIGELPPLPEIPPAALSQFNIFLLETVFDDYIADGHDMRDLYSRIHEKNMAALCLSGGGIRSATFNLGVLQGLAEKKLLTQFHYISTVSGGGYIGSWLSSWIRRHAEGPAGVAADLAAEPSDPLSPEVEPIQHLREYSSYLAPRGTALSVDTWTIIATYLRNLVLNWTMFLPALAAFLTIPRLVEVLVAAAMDPPVPSAPASPGVLTPFVNYSAYIALGAGLLGVIMVGAIRPALDQPSGPSEDAETLRAKRNTVWLWLIPLFAGAVAFTTMWAALTRGETWTGWNQVPIIEDGQLKWWSLPPIFIAGNLIAAVLYLIRHVAAKEVPPLHERPFRKWAQRFIDQYREGDFRVVGMRDAVIGALRGIRIGPFLAALRNLISNRIYRQRALGELAGAFGAGLVGGLLLNALFRLAFDPAELTAAGRLPRLEVFVCTAIPLFLLVFFLSASLHVGLTTPWSTEHDREWWSRTGALIFVFGIVYLVVSASAILVPMAVLELPPYVASLGGASAFATWILSRGNRTAANLKEREMVGAAPWAGVVLKFASLICLLLAVALISLATTLLLHKSGFIMAVPRVAAPLLEGWEAAESVRWHLDGLRNVSMELLIVFIAILLVTATVMSRALNVNIYSMHAMYRNRLIRAYLGASRWKRRPDPFTGFDPQDDIRMWQLRPEVIWPSSFIDPDAFLKRLNAGAGVKGSPFTQVPEAVQRHVAVYVANSSGTNRDDVQAEVVSELNALMLRKDIEHDVSAEPGLELLRDNRLFLDRYFAGVLHPMPVDGTIASPRTSPVNKDIIVGSSSDRRRPGLHVVNMALNLVGGDNLAWRERKADSFTVTPLHAGNRRLGYRDSSEYGDQISLGTAMAISGAAVSPNMGYHSSPVVTFLMTLFNARLGWWLGNPGAAGQKTYGQPGPARSLKSIVDEAFGRTNDKSPYVFLSDGGHFDNLGLYEMVLRRCRYIVACDASADRRYAFGDLANAIRKVRVDLGVDIELRSTVYIGPQENEKYGKYCAIGCIRYDQVDKKIDDKYANVGYLVYIKPVVYNDCPTDVRHYRQENDGFPHESTVDQFFSESQFESYRALGRYIVRQISETMDTTEEQTIFDLVHGAAAYVYQQQAPIGDRRVQNVSDLVGWMERSLQ